VRIRLAALLVVVLVSLFPATVGGGTSARHFSLARSFGLPARTYGASLVDFDGNGLPDPFLNWHNSRAPSLLQNLGGLNFARPEVPWNWPMDRHVCAWGEANGDGSPDLFCGQGARGGTGQGPNELWSTNPWIEWGAAAGIDNPTARTRSANWLDYDRDGDLDLFTGAVARDEFGDQLFRNDRGSFVPVPAGVSGLRTTQRSTAADWNRDGYPDLLLLQSGDNGSLRAFLNQHGTFVRTHIANSAGTWQSAAWGDYDGDGWPDLHLVGLSHSRILHNDHGTFRPVDDASLLRGRASAWFDVDNDGLLDLYVVQSALGNEAGGVGDARDVLIVQTKKGVFAKQGLPVTAGWAGAGQSVATGDVNGDHRVDVLVSNGRSRWAGQQQLLTNRTPAGNAASLVLVGTRWNPLGYGARIRITIGTHRRRLEITDGMAGSSQSSAVAHIALGTANWAWVRVVWPNGVCDRLKIQAATTRRLPIRSRGC
jgi:hypothetical protein